MEASSGKRLDGFESAFKDRFGGAGLHPIFYGGGVNLAEIDSVLEIVAVYQFSETRGRAIGK